MGKSAVRNYGVDIARIIAILFVVIIHNIGPGGVLGAQTETNVPWFLANVIENLGIVAVNVFGMITGYLMVGRKFKAVRILDIVFITIFWSIITTFIFETMGYDILSTKLFAIALPITHAQYWYTNAYIALAVIAPFINYGIEKVGELTFRRILIAIIILAGTAGVTDSIYLLGGYSGYWLIVLYLFGAYIKLHGDKIKISQFSLFLIYLFAALVELLVQYLLAFKTSVVFMGYNISTSLVSSYVAIPVVVGSIALFLFMIRINVKNSAVIRVLSFFAPLSFGIYLIDTSMLNGTVLTNLFTQYAVSHGIRAVIFAVVLGVVFYVGFALMEYARVLLFTLIRFDVFIKFLVSLFNKIVK